MAGRPTTASAQGFGVYEQGACTMGRAGTGVASPCADGSSIYYNPANIVNTRNVVSAGGTLIAPRGSFTNSLTGISGSLSDKIYPVPNLYIIKTFRDRFAAGIGVFAPYGLTTEWPATFEGRFLGEKTVIRGLYVQPTVAARFLDDRLSIGAGFDVNFARVELQQRVDLARQAAAPGVTFGQLGIASGTDFADARLTANGTGYGVHLGVAFKVTTQLDVGARFMSRQKVTFDNGSATFVQVPTNIVLPAGNPLGAPAGTPLDALLAPQFAAGGPLTTQPATAALRLPEQLVFGAAVQATSRIKLLGDAQYTHWKVFDAVPITFQKLPPKTLIENNRSVWTFRVGGEYAFSERTTGRLGVYTHRPAEPDYAVTPNLPEGARTSFTAGFGTRLGEQIRVDLAYQYIDQADRQGRTTDGGLAIPTAALNNGLYRFHAHLFGATFAYAF